MSNSWWHLGIVFLMLITSAVAEASIPDFFNELFTAVQTEYSAFRAAEFAEFCAENQLAAADPVNQETFFRVNFLHDLLTTSGAADCARGGFLRIPYFWHWIQPNPRHLITSLPEAKLLTAVKPPAPYERYASFADIDRVPALYLGDLVAEAPGYSHPHCGSFFSFGWCSEREMAFTALVVAWGYAGKIWQSGIHTYSVVCGEFKKTDGSAVVLAADVDNTFASISWHRIPGTMPQDQWLTDIGAGAQIAWYNRQARSPGQITALQETPVGAEARARISRLVRQALAGDQ